MVFGEKAAGLGELGGWVEIARDDEDVIRVGLGYGSIGRFDTNAGTLNRADSRKGCACFGCLRLGQQQIGRAWGRTCFGGDPSWYCCLKVFERRALRVVPAHHGGVEHDVGVAALHAAVMVGLAALEVVDREDALKHGNDITVAHQRAWQPDFGV